MIGIKDNVLYTRLLYCTLMKTTVMYYTVEYCNMLDEECEKLQNKNIKDVVDPQSFNKISHYL